MIIYCLDLSLNGTGMAVIEPSTGGKVKILHTMVVNNKRIDTDQRGKKLVNIGNQIVNDVWYHEPDVIVREKGFSKFATATQSLYSVVGVMDYVLAKRFPDKLYSTLEYAPTTVKKRVTGSGKASKPQVARRVRDYLIPEQYDFVFDTDDVSDAVAVGITYLLDNKIIEEITL